MSTQYSLDYNDVLDEEHLAGLHFDDPHPLCWQCEEDERPEAPDPTYEGE